VIERYLSSLRAYPKTISRFGVADPPVAGSPRHFTFSNELLLNHMAICEEE
jgi:hypothetical protein